MMIETLGIYGVGLIGGSLSLALQSHAQVGKVIGFGRNEERLQNAKNVGIIDQVSLDIKEAERCDVLVICTPVRTMPSVFCALESLELSNTVLTDVGSVKGYVVEQAEKALGSNFSRFVPGHPIAGTEKSGFEAAFATLYNDRRVILTPTEQTDAQATQVIQAMWQQAGAEVAEMSIEQHDRVLAATSHLPHLLAFGLVDSLAKLDEHDAIFRFAAGGFRDFTRIASSDVGMWRDITLTNRDAILTVLDEYELGLQSLRDALGREDEDYISGVFQSAHDARAEYMQRYEPKINK